MQGMLIPSLGLEDSLEEEMTTHSSILAWKILWTKEPSRLQSFNLKRIRNNYKIEWGAPDMAGRGWKSKISGLCIHQSTKPARLSLNTCKKKKKKHQKTHKKNRTTANKKTASVQRGRVAKSQVWQSMHVISCHSPPDLPPIQAAMVL